MARTHFTTTHDKDLFALDLPGENQGTPSLYLWKFGRHDSGIMLARLVKQAPKRGMRILTYDAVASPSDPVTD
jgi:hypothetical protein